MATGLLRDERCTVPRRLEIFPKCSERQNCVSYRRISQAGLKDLPGLFDATQLHVKNDLVEKYRLRRSISSCNLNQTGLDQLRVNVLFGATSTSAIDRLTSEKTEERLVAVASTTSTGTFLANWLILIAFDLSNSIGS